MLRVKFPLSVLIWMSALFGVVPGQLLVVPRSLTGVVTVLDDDLAPQAAINVAQARHVATNGVDRVWAVSPSHAKLYRLEVGTNDLQEVGFGDTPLGLAMTGAGGVVVATQTAIGNSHVVRFGPDLTFQSTFAAMPGAELVAVDRDDDVWVVHRPNNAPATLGHYSSVGALLSLHPLGVLPTTLVIDRFGYVWVLCGLSRQLYRYTATGDLVSILELDWGATGLAVGRSGEVVIAYATANAIELRDPTGEIIYTHPVFGAPSAAAFAGDGTLVTYNTTAGSILSWDEGLGGWSALALGTGIHAVGDPTGTAWAGAAGRHVDSDGDGTPNGVEWTFGSNPFDAASRAFDVSVSSANAPGLPSLVELESPGFPDAVYWFGASHAPAPYGAGANGFSLLAGPLFDFVQIVGPPPAGVLDGFGRGGFMAVIPDVPTLAGFVVWVGYQVFPEFPCLEPSYPSPPFAVLIT